MPPEELDAQVAGKQCGVEFQLFTSLLRFGSGWFANHSLASNAGERFEFRFAMHRRWPGMGDLTSLNGVRVPHENTHHYIARLSRIGVGICGRCFASTAHASLSQAPHLA
ncbi:MAG: hypothetical protein HOP33_05550 [Verrucomicrobia bacterium]|nr:hypothetical protein [Verrucomicrobiota bacterium]